VFSPAIPQNALRRELPDVVFQRENASWRRLASDLHLCLRVNQLGNQNMKTPILVRRDLRGRVSLLLLWLLGIPLPILLLIWIFRG
jgi:hypothetical protein